MKAGRYAHMANDMATRRLKVAELVMAGATGAAIVNALGVSKATVSRDIAAVREMWKTEYVEAYNGLVDREYARLERLLRAIWPAAIGGNVKAVEACIKISESKRRLLGTDAPVKVELTTFESRTGLAEMTDAELDKRIAALSKN